MKTFGWFFLFLLVAQAHASNSGTLLLRAHVPVRTKVVLDPHRGTFSVQSNEGKYALATEIREGRDLRGFRIITVIHH